MIKWLYDHFIQWSYDHRHLWHRPLSGIDLPFSRKLRTLGSDADCEILRATDVLDLELGTVGDIDDGTLNRVCVNRHDASVYYVIEDKRNDLEAKAFNVPGHPPFTGELYEYKVGRDAGGLTVLRWLTLGRVLAFISDGRVGSMMSKVGNVFRSLCHVLVDGGLSVMHARASRKSLTLAETFAKKRSRDMFEDFAAVTDDGADMVGLNPSNDEDYMVTLPGVYCFLLQMHYADSRTARYRDVDPLKVLQLLARLDALVVGNRTIALDLGNSAPVVVIRNGLVDVAHIQEQQEQQQLRRQQWTSVCVRSCRELHSPCSIYPMVHTLCHSTEHGMLHRRDHCDTYNLDYVSLGTIKDNARRR